MNISKAFAVKIVIRLILPVKLLSQVELEVLRFTLYRGEIIVRVNSLGW